MNITTTEPKQTVSEMLFKGCPVCSLSCIRHTGVDVVAEFSTLGSVEIPLFRYIFA